jgi:hypothetical protein
MMMSAEEFENWMTRNNVTSVDVAAALKIDPITVKRFLKGMRVRRSTLDGFERFRAERDKRETEAPAAG